MLHDPLANAMANLKNYELSGKNDCIVEPASNLIKDVLHIMQKEGYVGNLEYIDDGKAGKFKVRLVGKINNCGVIKPRYPVKVDDFELWEKRFLPAREFGILIISTPHGVMTHKTAYEKRTGGVLLAYIY